MEVTPHVYSLQLQPYFTVLLSKKQSPIRLRDFRILQPPVGGWINKNAACSYRRHFSSFHRVLLSVLDTPGAARREQAQFPVIAPLVLVEEQAPRDFGVQNAVIPAAQGVGHLFGGGKTGLRSHPADHG